MQFGLRGRHEHIQMLWGDVEIKQDAAGHEFLEFFERATKTRKGSTDQVELFAQKCSLQVYKTYLTFEFISF